MATCRQLESHRIKAAAQGSGFLAAYWKFSRPRLLAVPLCKSRAIPMRLRIGGQATRRGSCRAVGEAGVGVGVSGELVA
eukprot:6184930-Pleurochrysis_carterae.AAC.1